MFNYVHTFRRETLNRISSEMERQRLYDFQASNQLETKANISQVLFFFNLFVRLYVNFILLPF